MRILAIDVGTGTQDILLFDSAGPVENSFKMVMPSPTEMVAAEIRRATQAGRAVALTGVTMGGGPCGWALERHLQAGLAAYATPEAAKTFDDDLEAVARLGVRLVSGDEIKRLPGAECIRMRDLNLEAIRRALAAFGVEPQFAGLAIGCLDHGAAPPGYSDRLFRFEHLRRVVEARNDLRAFAYLPHEVPSYLTRAQAMLSCVDMDVPVVFLDTGPAAALGALQDSFVAQQEEQLVLNLGNMHALAFHLRGTHIRALYEHHTGEVTGQQIEEFSERLISGELRHGEVFDSKGHGVYYAVESRSGDSRRPLVAVTGPQRAKLRGSRLDPYFAVPHGDMMLSGCFGLVWAFTERHPQWRAEVLRALALTRYL